MYFKSIEVQGFKSFAQKIVFEFHGGITGIVGPNGSGKSNVADAVRWVLGEQSAKSLRGSNMQDVIFAGTENRKPQGFAFVSLTFDNKDRTLNYDADEVKVTRKLYRSGESEYLLNDNNCRLKDVQELFYDTGIGKDGYSIIGQGQIDKILSGKPEERRELFDEAAGIVKFKKRRQAAVKNLDNEHQNLLRVQDILSELNRQMGPLKRQAEKAKEYRRLSDEAKTLDIGIFNAENGVIQARIDDAVGKLSIVANDLQESSEARDQVIESYQAAEQQKDAADSEFTVKSDAHNKAALLTQSLQGQITLILEQLNSDDIRLNTATDRLAQIDVELQARKAQKRDYQTQKGELNSTQDKLDEQLTAYQAKIDDESDNIRVCEDELNRIREHKDDAAAQLQGISGRQEYLSAMSSQYKDSRTSLKESLKAEKEKLSSQQKAVSLLKSRLKEQEETIKTAAASVEEFNRQKNEHQLQRKKLLENRDKASYKYQSISSRLESLKNIAERYEGFGNAVKRVMEHFSTNVSVHGTVADLIHVERQYEVAIETALGGSIQNIVTKDERTASSCIEYLKSAKAGRATFLPMDALKEREPVDVARYSSEPGVIDKASALITLPKGFEKLGGFLLGGILVVDTMENALRLNRKYGHRLRIVTLEGELLSPGGAISGGAYKNSSNLLGRKRELEQLETQAAEAKEAFNKVQNALQNANDRLAELENQLEQSSETSQNAQMEKSRILIMIRQAQEEAERLKASVEKLGKDLSELDDSIKEADVNKAQLKEAQKEMSSREKGILKEIQTTQQKLDKSRQKKDFAILKLNEVKVLFAQTEERNNFLLTNLERITREISSLKTERDTLLQTKQSIETQKAARTQNRETLVLSMNDAAKSAQELKARLEELSTTRETLAAKLKRISVEKDSCVERVNSLELEKVRLENLRDRNVDARERYVSHLWNDYEMTPSEAASYPIKSELTGADAKKRLNELKTSIRGLGSVNVNAVEEYAQVSERQSFMQSQYNDIVKAEGTLQQVIDDLDKGMREKFEQTFRQIAVEFDKVFKELFGGGKGTLSLTEGEDILEAGIQIIAQPPGKKLQNMMQLSGGEKALTAICMLFAIQNLKPSPFCLLDEIEAALDDPNVNRFAQYLNKLKSNTQFIVITHRRGSMLIADQLYGITMQEKGVSSLVSVDLTD